MVQDQVLLSSSMDKTVRLWDMATKSCLKMFAHNDYVTCIQFNPLDDSVFLNSSLDAKFRLWDIPDLRMVDWTDLHEMVTAACYTPEGQLTVDFGGKILSALMFLGKIRIIFSLARENNGIVLGIFRRETLD